MLDTKGRTKNPALQLSDCERKIPLTETDLVATDQSCYYKNTGQPLSGNEKFKNNITAQPAEENRI